VLVLRIAIIGRKGAYDESRRDSTGAGAKRQSGLAWREIAEKLGNGSPVFYTAALLGHHALTREEAQKAAALLKLDAATATMLTSKHSSRPSV